MAEDDREDYVDIAAAIADGREVDWRALESAAATPEDRDRVRRLELLAGIGRLHADLTGVPAPSSLHDSLLHPSGIPGETSEAAAPVTWGPLTVIEKTGQGTFGDVYRARESRLDREVALKLLRRRDDRRADGTQIIEEARLLAKVRHPNVTTVYGADRIRGRVGLWMEFVKGRTLAEILRTEDRSARAKPPSSVWTCAARSPRCTKRRCCTETSRRTT